MRLTVLAAAAVGSAVALVGFAGAANASATVDLIWAKNGTDQISAVNLSSAITLQVILTAGPNGSYGAGVSIDYNPTAGKLVMLGYSSTPSDPEGDNLLPLQLGDPIDTGTRIENINSVAFPPFFGTGLLEGQSHQLGTVTFHKGGIAEGTFEIGVDGNGATDGVLDGTGRDITLVTTFNGARLINTPELGTLPLLITVGGMMLAGRGRRS
jgi:uncharacterized membrane protein